MKPVKAPAKSLILSALSMGWGVEDIAVAAGCRSDQVREVVAELRRDGIIQNIHFDRPRRCG